MRHPFFLALPLCVVLVAPLHAQKPAAKDTPLVDKLRSPREADRPLADKLRSPRETLKTLFFAAALYDLFPEMMQDGVACLDLDAVQPRPGPEDAVLLALGVEDVLQTLAIPLSVVPDQREGETCVIHDADGFDLTLRRGRDEGWRFTATTLAKLPAMRRAARELRKAKPGDCAALREGFTDPRATIRQFLSDAYHGDFYAASRALDLSNLSDEQRREQGPALAQRLACVMQRRGFLFRQEVPYQTEGPAYTWHANGQGRVALDRVRQPDGKDAWLFTRQTARNVPAMYQAVKDAPPDGRYQRMGLVVPAPEAAASLAVQKRPEEVPPHLGSPRALLRGFFRTMEAADVDDARLADALEYLDLKNVTLADRAPLGGKLATKLELVLRKLPIDLSAVPDGWNAPPQVLGEAQGVRVEVLRQRDGCWRFSEATVARVPEMFDKLLAGKVRPEQENGTHLDSARDTLVTFQTASARRDFATAARCLNLADIHASAREELGSALAFKLKYVLDRVGRVYVQEVPDNPEGPRYVLYRGVLGRVVLDRKAEEPGKGQWQFTQETVQRVEAMFLAVLGTPPDESQQGTDVVAEPTLWETPGVWLRLRLPAWARVRAGSLDLYQWLGLLLAGLASWAGSRVVMAVVTRLVAWVLRRGGSALSTSFVASTLRPLTWLGAVWVFYVLLDGLDLPAGVAGKAFAVHKFLLAGLVGWLGLRAIDLSMSVYTNSELLRPHRSLGDMIVPVGMRLAKGGVTLVVAVYVIYEIGQADLLGRFLTGLGVAGLAASLAAQDAMKSFFGTLLLIGERAFKIGDCIIVGDKQGVVEQVGFRSTRLRTGEDSLLTIPNSVIAAAPIDNMGARTLHRLSTTLLVSPETELERLLEFRARLQTWAAAQELVVPDKVDIHLHRLTNSGAELSLSLFLAACPPARETLFRDALNCETLRLAEELGVAMAPTTRPVHLRNAGQSAARAA